MKLSHTVKVVAAAATLAVLAIPAIASAHPGVYTSQSRLATTAAKQTITVTATGGTYKPSANAGTIAYNATAAQVFAALRQDPAILDDVSVTGADGGPYSLTFIGRLAGKAVAALAPVTSGLTGGTATVTVTSAGGATTTYTTSNDGTAQAVQVKYVVGNDGYAGIFTENNGVSQATEGGQLNYQQMSSGWRTPMTLAQKLAFGPAQTDLQVHATCTGVAALQDPANIAAAEPGNGSDPYYNYIPWQSTSAGMGDSPSVWIPAVKTITNGLPGAPAGGVDLTGMTAAQATTACTALGGTYHAADTKAAIDSAQIADAVAPLNTQITTLGSQVASLQSDNSVLGAAKAAAEQNAAAAAAAQAAAEGQVGPAKAGQSAAEAALAKLKDRPLELTLAAKRFSGGSGVALVTGPEGASAKVTVTLTKKAASSLGLKSGTVDTATKKLGAQGAELVTLSPSKAVAKALKTHKGSFAADVVVTAGTKSDKTSAALSR